MRHISPFDMWQLPDHCALSGPVGESVQVCEAQAGRTAGPVPVHQSKKYNRECVQHVKHPT